MPTFGAIGVAGTGMTMHRIWLDAIGDNITNASTVRRTDEPAFAARMVIAREADGAAPSGVRVAGALLGDTTGRLVHEPTHPLADEEGYVRYPDIDMASQMSQLLMAQRGYQASAAVVDRAKETYEAALQIGRS